MSGYAAEAERTLIAIRDLFGTPTPLDTPNSPTTTANPNQPGWNGTAAESQHRGATTLTDRHTTITTTDNKLTRWAADVAEDTTRNRNNATALVGSARTTNAALAPYQGTVQGRIALIRALTDHLATAGGLVNDHLNTLPGRQQQLAAATANYNLPPDPNNPTPPPPPRRPHPHHPKRHQPHRRRRRGSGAPWATGGGGGPAGGGGRPMSGMSGLGSLSGAGLRSGPGAGGGSMAAGVAGAGLPQGALPGGPATFGPLNADQMNVAKVFVAEAMRRGLPRPLAIRAAEMAIGCGMQESGLRILSNPNVPESERLPHNGEGHDHDSVGPLQQRQSWGRTADLMNPATSVNKFYDQLLKVPGWSSMRFTAAIQSVQRSGLPTAYAKHEALATQVVRAIMGGE
ncbi:MAG: hypothetical protein AB7G47_20270 [Mycolicibacterium sp.]|uniref:hypothetical protein n=2 Tax=Mycolicibacterium sp. TaxID=2320850 RepID=UPI003D108E8A